MNLGGNSGSGEIREEMGTVGLLRILYGYMRLSNSSNATIFDPKTPGGDGNERIAMILRPDNT